MVVDLRKEAKKAERYVYVLTAEHNQYDQYGEYFIAVFGEVPSLEHLAEFLSDKQEHVTVPTKTLQAVAFLENIRKGGGRRGTEDSWYNLKKTKVL